MFFVPFGDRHIQIRMRQILLEFIEIFLGEQRTHSGTCLAHTKRKKKTQINANESGVNI